MLLGNTPKTMDDNDGTVSDNAYFISLKPPIPVISAG
jgi:hypothetical protein